MTTHSSLLHLNQKSLLRLAQSHSVFLDDTRRHGYGTFLSHFQPVEYKPGDVIIAQGDSSCSGYYIVDTGKCSVFVETFACEEGVPVRVAYLERGETFGELSTMYSQPRAATIIADTKVTAWRIEEKFVLEFVERNRDLAEKIAHRRAVRSVLQEVPWFFSVDDEYERERIISTFAETRVPAGQAIVQQNQSEVRPFFRIILKGTCAISSTDPKTGNPVKVGVLSSGDTFGETVIFTKRNPTSTITAESDVVLLEMDATEFLKITQEGARSLWHLFMKNASSFYNGQHYMSRRDFRASVASTKSKTNSKISDMLFDIALGMDQDQAKDLISFTDFVYLSCLLQHRDSEYLIAFHFFDQNHDGRISRDEFRAAVFALQDSFPLVSQSHAQLIHDEVEEIDKIFGSSEFMTYERFKILLKDGHLPNFVSFWNNVLIQVRKSSEEWMQTAIDTGEDLISSSSHSKSRSPMKYLISGGIAGAISRTVTSPLIRLKMLMQTQSSTNPHIKGVAQGLQYMYKQGGVRAFFLGNGTNVARIAPTTGIQFLMFETYKSWIQPNPEIPLTGFERLLAGGFAGMTATYFIRARLTVQDPQLPQYKGIIDCAVQVYKKEGALAFYRGLWPSLCGIFPYIGIDFYVYGALKPYVSQDPETGQHDTLGLLACGGVAGAISQTVAFPLELVRRRMQVQGFLESDAKYKFNGGVWDALTKVYEHEGIHGLFRGLVPNYLKAIPSIGISFVVYERMKWYFQLQ